MENLVCVIEHTEQFHKIAAETILSSERWSEDVGDNESNISRNTNRKLRFPIHDHKNGLMAVLGN